MTSNTTDILDQLDAIISAKPVDAASMQVFDAIALATKLDKQLRNLASYIVESQAMSLSIDVSESKTITRLVNNQPFCVIVVDKTAINTRIVVSFSNRVIWNARAFSINDAGVQTNFPITASDDNRAWTIPNCTSAIPITLQFY